jgi:PleD family two-component response regulator
MTDPRPRLRPPLTLIANSQEWHSRSLESILGPHGYAVLRAYTGKQAVERAAEARPDLIFVDTDLPDRDGFDVVREIRAHPMVSPSTPIIMTSPGHASRQRRLDALRAGAWDYIGAAIDGEELPLRLDALVSAKMEADRVREEGLLDEITGLYNLRGLARRAREVGSQAFRQKEPLACIVITPLVPGAADANERVIEELARVLRNTGRSSDVIGTLGPGEFAIIAGGTDSAGAERLAQRLGEAASAIFGAEDVKVAVGYDAVQNYSESPIDPSDMLSRATAAMRRSRTGATAERLSLSRFEATLN